MKRRTRLVLVGTGLGALAPLAAYGNVYPTNLGQSSNSLDTSLAQSVTFSYLLNEAATSVQIEVLDSSNAVVRTLSGSVSKGTNAVVWDGKDNANNPVPNGKYTFRVTSAGASRANWELISSDTTLNNFELPRGVAVNTNPNSPYYGRVYISNPRTNSTAAGRTMGDGFYMVNADFSDTSIAGGTGPHTGGVDWSLDGSGAVGPFRLQVGPDDNVYITNWSDAQSGLWVANPNLTTATEVLDSSGRDGDGLNVTHGSISDVVVVGTGANRRIYTTDEDMGPFNINQYNIGNATTFTGAPTATFFDNAAQGNHVINAFDSLAQANDGTFWLSQNRFGGTDEASLFQIDADGNIIWDSLSALGSPDPLRQAQGMAYDPVNNLIAMVTNRTGGVIVIFDVTTKSVLTEFEFGATTNTDVAFDNAGNLYVGNRSAERVRVWSPPNTGGLVANQFSTWSMGPLGEITVVPEPASMLLLGLAAGLGLHRRNRRA